MPTTIVIIMTTVLRLRHFAVSFRSGERRTVSLKKKKEASLGAGFWVFLVMARQDGRDFYSFHAKRGRLRGGVRRLGATPGLKSSNLTDPVTRDQGCGIDALMVGSLSVLLAGRHNLLPALKTGSVTGEAHWIMYGAILGSFGFPSLAGNTLIQGIQKICSEWTVELNILNQKHGAMPCDAVIAPA